MRESAEPLAMLDTEDIESVLEAAPVTLAVVYGSHARGEATTASDVDIAVVFETALSSTKRTRIRLELIERLSKVLNTDDIDVVPLAEMSPELQREVCEDGVVIVGTQDALEQYCPLDSHPQTREERLAKFDELLTEMDQVV